MIKKVGLFVLALPVIGVLVLALLLLPSHWQIRQVEPALPTLEAIIDALRVDGGPTTISYINTASQSGPAGGTIGHPGVVIEWANGRRFLIDTGMPPAPAIEFGKLLEKLLGSDPVEAYGAVHTQLGGALESVRGIAFTHLHPDHTAGLRPLCNKQGKPATVFQTPRQRELMNYSTEQGDADLEGARCDRQKLDGELIKTIPGFPGLLAIAVGGHTPGSTIYVVRIEGTAWVFAGDITNDMQSLHNNKGKPWLYSTLIVPENTGWLGELRVWLESIDQATNFEVLVAHDIRAFEASALPAWKAGPAG